MDDKLRQSLKIPNSRLDAINAVLSSTDTEKALETAVSGVNSVLTKYSSK